MACEVTHDAVIEPRRIGLDGAANDVDVSARSNRHDCPTQRLLGALDEKPGFLAGLTGDEGFVEIPVHAVVERGDVDIDDVALLDHRVIGNSVTNRLVH